MVGVTLGEFAGVDVTIWDSFVLLLRLPSRITSSGVASGCASRYRVGMPGATMGSSRWVLWE